VLLPFRRNGVGGISRDKPLVDPLATARTFALWAVPTNKLQKPAWVDGAPVVPAVCGMTKLRFHLAAGAFLRVGVKGLNTAAQ
jgi:hypothetical protein